MVSRRGREMSLQQNIEELTLAIAKNQHDANSYYLRGLAYFQVDNIDGALDTGSCPKILPTKSTLNKSKILVNRITT